MLQPKNTSLQWPDRDDHLVIVEMLASSESAAWTTCLTYVSRRVSIQASHLPYDYLDDITQDVMLLIVRNLSAFRGHSRLSTWIIRIVRNCTARFYRDYLFLPSLTDSLSNPSTRKKLHSLQLASASPGSRGAHPFNPLSRSPGHDPDHSCAVVLVLLRPSYS